MERAPATIQQQAEFVESLYKRTIMSDGTRSTEALLVLEPEDADDLLALYRRLYRIAPFEAEVRALVTGKSE